MTLRIQTKQLDVPAETRSAVERRVRLALGRHAAEIEHTQVSLRSGLNGHRCRIRIRLRRGESLAIEDRAADPSDAAAGAASRLESRLEHRRARRLSGLGRRPPV